jgi:hypothetical protein
MFPVEEQGVCLASGFLWGKTMSACFQRVIDAIIRELGMGNEIGAYMDDIMWSYFSKEESITKAVTVIDMLTHYKIIINQKKSYFAGQTMPTLGYVVDGNGLHKG